MIFDSSNPNIGDSLDINSGNNRISDNFQYDIYNNSSTRVLAQNNVWASTDIKEINKIVFDRLDQSSAGSVVVQPVLNLVNPNSALTQLKNKAISNLSDKNLKSNVANSTKINENNTKKTVALNNTIKNQIVKENDKNLGEVQKKSDPIISPVGSLKN